MTIYLFLKVFHVVSILIWIAGMFRLCDFYQHRETRENELEAVLDFDSTWTSPAMLGAWCAGMGMTVIARWWNHRWFLWKFLLVISLSAVHGVMVGRLRREQPTEKGRTHVWWLVLILAGVVSLVIIKP
ncbi:MAG: CopD family protein [Vulcanimicrobiota bacterium]